MGRKSVLGTLACGLLATSMVPNTAMAVERVTASEKGSVLIFSKVEIRWDAAGSLLQDTFICLTNDFPDDVVVQMYFINGDAPLAADPLATPPERAHPGWNWVDNRITLTGDQPVAWSAVSGQPAGVSPFATALDPGFPPGRPCLDVGQPGNPAAAGTRCMRGFIIAWAEDGQSNEINWNHLSGYGTIVNYGVFTAWEYPAYAFQCLAAVANGAPTGISAGQLDLDGVEYEPGFDLLLLQFQAQGSGAFGGPVGVTSNTDITLYPIDADLRQESDGPVTTKASYEVWNMNELKFSGLHRCVTCWDQTLISQYTNAGPANHLTLQNLQTDHGKARIDGLQSQLCDVDFDPNNNADFPFPPGVGDPVDDRDIVSQAASLLGVKASYLTFGAGTAYARAGGNLVGMGTQNGVIQADGVGAPPSDESDVRTPVKSKEVNDSFDSFVKSTRR